MRLNPIASVFILAACAVSALAAADPVVKFADAGRVLLTALSPGGKGPEASAAAVSVVDERAGVPGRAATPEGLLVAGVAQQVAFAAAARPTVWQVVEGDFIVLALQEKERAADADASWDKVKQYGNFDLAGYVLACDARRETGGWALSLRLVDLRTGLNRGSARCLVTLAEGDALVSSRRLGDMAALGPGLRASLGAGFKAGGVGKAGKPAVAVGGLRFAERDVGGPAGEFIAGELERALSDLARVVRLPGGERPDVRALATLRDRFPGQLPDAVLEGRYYDEGEAVRLYWDLVGVADGQLLAQGSLAFRAADLPRGLALAPPASPVPTWSLARVGEGAQASAAASAGFTVELSTDKGSSAVYRDGEALQLWVRASRDCWIKLYHFDVEGRRKLIFPNAYQKDNFIKAGGLLPFPGASAPFAFRLEPPFGTERIKLVASTVPFSGTEEDFSTGASLGTGAQGMTRGLSIQPQAAVAEALVSYVIVGK